MATYTEKLGLKMPAQTDFYNVDDFNENFRKIDENIAAAQTKLAGIDDNANNYTHPASHPPSIIAQDASNRFVSDTEKSAWNSKAAGTHSHAQSDVTGLSTALSGKADKSYVDSAIETAIGAAIGGSY